MPSITAQLFTRWKVARGFTSDRAALQSLGVSHGAAVHWKAGRNADADVIERMARDLGENAGALVAQAMAEQTKGEAARTWARIAKQLGAAAALVLAVALPWRVNDADGVKLNDGRDVHYAQWLRRLAAWFATMGRRIGGFNASPVLA